MTPRLLRRNASSLYQVSPTFRLGNESSSFVRIEVLRRERPEATDYWDGNWLASAIELAAGPWKGEFQASLRSDEFADFRGELQRLFDGEQGSTAEFKSMEPWLRLKVERSDDLGHITVSGAAQTQPFFNGQNVLQFVLELDQSYLPASLAGLADIVKQFPVLGTPDD